MMGRQAHASPTGNEMELSMMDGDNVSVLGRIVQAARERRRAAANAYMLALASSVAVGECAADVEHEHRQFYLRGLDLMVDEVSC